MKIRTKFYGELEIAEEEIICFPNGLPGFENDDQFIYIHQDQAVFGCLQSCKNPDTAFVVISPFTICPDYNFELPDEKAKELGISKTEEVLLLSIVTIPQGKPNDATVNLQAPIVINTTEKKGAQIILTDLGYPLHCRLWAEKPNKAATAGK
jgi:flagellar assembly factor FliW